jgi:nicotinamide riboside kinase
MKFQNVYFINGNAYAGKSTMVKLLAEKYNGILCEENYQDIILDQLDKNEFPALTYTRDLKDWTHFIRRTPDEYEKWIKDVTKECTIIELQILKKLLNQNKPIFVDTNIPVEVLHKISDTDHVLIMLANPDISVNRFFEREDRDKQFLYQLLISEENKEQALKNFKECLKRINNEQTYNEFLNSGFNVIIRDENRTVEQTLSLVELIFKLK